jgi:hypothetical protein
MESYLSVQQSLAEKSLPVGEIYLAEAYLITFKSNIPTFLFELQAATLTITSQEQGI